MNAFDYTDDPDLNQGPGDPDMRSNKFIPAPIGDMPVFNPDGPHPDHLHVMTEDEIMRWPIVTEDGKTIDDY